MSFSGTLAKNVEELVANTKSGILVTNFWYIRYVSQTDLTINLS